MAVVAIQAVLIAIVAAATALRIMKREYLPLLEELKRTQRVQKRAAEYRGEKEDPEKRVEGEVADYLTYLEDSGDTEEMEDIWETLKRMEETWGGGEES